MSLRTLVLPLMAVTLLAGCAGMAGSGPSATAAMASTIGSQATGSATFTQSGDKVIVSGEMRGLAPNKEHGFHVHEKGDCSSGDGMSTGGHFNPGGGPHGQHGMGTHHAGDLPSLKADANGMVRFRFESATIRVGSGANDVVGKGLIVHRDPDDYRTQPTGNSGPRVACGIIQRG